MRCRFLAFVFAILLPCCAASFAAAQTTFTESVFHSFSGADGASPLNLILAQDGNFYGIAGGGAHGAGVIFKVTPAGQGSIFYTFTGQPEANVSAAGTLIQGHDGNFYGSSFAGGANNEGAVFEVTTGGNYSTLYSFTGLADGNSPTGLVQGSDGNFYGSTSTGNENAQPGTSGYSYSGTFYQVTTAGSYKLLGALEHSNGSFPFGSLVEAVPGTFLATADDGGALNEGVVDSVSGSGIDLLYSFSNGAGAATVPVTGLVGGPGNEFYAGTSKGGGQGGGELYSITASGSYAPLSNLPYGSGGSNGVGSALTAASDGNLYGAYLLGNGVLFKMTPSGSLTSIYTFGAAPDASSPQGALLQGADGNLYGAAMNGGANSAGAIFKLTPSAAFTPPVKLTLGSSSTGVSQAVTLAWTVANAFSVTAQQCFAFVQGGATGAGSWSGQKAVSGSTSITPTAAGTYTYALTCGGVESGFATLTVGSSTSGATSTTLAATPNPISVGQAISVSATVAKTSGSGTPTGSVKFSVDGTVLATVLVGSGGVASFSSTTNGYLPGVYPMIATYSGDSNFSSSTSATDVITLQKSATAVTLSASPNPVTRPDNITLTATVKRPTGSTGTPTGSVTFYAGSSKLLTVGVNASGVAGFTSPTGAYPAGTYQVTAQYGGDSSDAASTSAALPVTLH